MQLTSFTAGQPHVQTLNLSKKRLIEIGECYPTDFYFPVEIAKGLGFEPSSADYRLNNGH